MTNLNRIVLVGRLTANPEVLNTIEGSTLSKFTLAVDRPARPDGTKETDFINIVTFGRLAERCAEFLSKGRLVLVEGRIQNRSYQTQDGEKKWLVEVVANKMRILDSKKAEITDLELEEIPFGESPDDLKSGEFIFEEDIAGGIETAEVPF